MSQDLIDTFLADPQDAELQTQWESQYPDPRNKVFIRHCAYRAATGFNTLVAILEQELEITQSVIACSPKLLASGKPAKIEVVSADASLIRENKTPAEWTARVDAEAERLGVHWAEVMIEASEATIKFWELQTINRLAYTEDRQICTFSCRDKSQLFVVSPDGMSNNELENVI